VSHSLTKISPGRATVLSGDGDIIGRVEKWFQYYASYMSPSGRAVHYPYWEAYNAAGKLVGEADSRAQAVSLVAQQLQEGEG
jgi:hypothetical protein